MDCRFAAHRRKMDARIADARAAQQEVMVTRVVINKVAKVAGLRGTSEWLSSLGANARHHAQNLARRLGVADSDIAILHILSLPALGCLKRHVNTLIGSQMMLHLDGGVVLVEYPTMPSGGRATRDTPDAGSEDMPEAMTLAVEAMTSSQKSANLARDWLLVDQAIGHADRTRRFPMPVTITFAKPRGRSTGDVRKGFVVLPVCGLASPDTTGLELSQLCARGCFTDVEKTPPIQVGTAVAAKAKRQLATSWKASIASESTRLSRN